MTGKELAEILTDFVNTSNNEKFDEFVKAFSNEHRTLQQLGLGLMLRLIEHMASDEYKTDLRNEESKKIAKTLIKGFNLAKKLEYVDEGISEAKAEEYMSTESAKKPSKYLPLI